MTIEIFYSAKNIHIKNKKVPPFELQNLAQEFITQRKQENNEDWEMVDVPLSQDKSEIQEWINKRSDKNNWVVYEREYDTNSSTKRNPYEPISRGKHPATRVKYCVIFKGQ